MQKTLSEVNDCPQRDRSETEWYEGVQTFMWICEDNIVEVPFDKEHLFEQILSPANLNRSYKAVIGNKGCGGIYNPQIQISAESETKRSIFREKDKTKRSKKESAQHSKSRNKSFVMTSVSAL